MSGVVHFNGAMVHEDEARLHVSDAGWLHGAGLFETIRAENGRPFRLEDHLARLTRSANALLRPLSRDRLPDTAAIRELLDRNGLQSARIRITVSAGPMRGQEVEEALTICATATALVPYPAKFYDEGIKVVVCPYKQSKEDATAGHKTTGYLPRLLGLRKAQEANCPEALWFNTQNELAEGCISNVFLVLKGAVMTPPLDTPVLPGITRAVVLQLAKELECPVEERRLTVDELLTAEECFLTNSIMGVMPVVRVERHDFADGRVGSVTRKLRSGYEDLVRLECRE